MSVTHEFGARKLERNLDESGEVDLVLQRVDGVVSGAPSDLTRREDDERRAPAEATRLDSRATAASSCTIPPRG